MERRAGSTPEREDRDRVYVGGGASRGLGDAALLSVGQRRRRAFTLVGLTLIIPGSAQLAGGHRTLGRIGLRVWVSLLGSILVLALLGLVSHTALLGLVSRSWFLVLLQWVLAGWALLWAVLFVDAWRLSQPSSLLVTTRRWLTVSLVGLLAATSGVLLYGSTNVASARGALDAVFVGGRASDASDGRYNVLLLGSDSGKGRVGTRPDSIQLASVDEKTGSTVIIGFARDMENIDFRAGSVMASLMPEGWNCGDECLLNGLYTWAHDHQAEFPAGTADPGVLATREAVEAISGLDVHYYVMVDLSGFRKLVDAVGGIDVNVLRRTPIGGGHSPIVGWIEKGPQRLDGYDALWYARSREGSSNYERMARQRCVLTAMSRQLDPQTVVLHFKDIAGASKGLIETDLPESELATFADLALKAREQKIHSVNLVPPLIKPWDYDAAFVRTTIADALRPATRKKKASSSAAGHASGSPSGSGSGTASGTASGTGSTTEPGTGSGTPTVEQTPGGTADEADLAEVCSGG